jgi:hypothetical protein
MRVKLITRSCDTVTAAWNPSHSEERNFNKVREEIVIYKLRPGTIQWHRKTDFMANFIPEIFRIYECISTYAHTSVS